ncbi:hypothetical protein DFR30_2503 [Thiogranum longum]|uniref:Uncharacterized protein n=1 Tax=Thiogranum longum TaxID=1537524 RepID=A0A4V2PH35_9GAMM|nr:hypothetical protein [Thiogranum longum]TCK19206.1 hypothetical protein DFR30_2503 [Thiogranum longum]
MPSEESMPKWDVALAAMASDACKQKAAPLTLDDFHQLAAGHAIRLDDIMETVFLLVINNKWRYTDASGNEQQLDQDTLDRLYVKRRLSEKDLATFNGGWEPRQT